MARRPTPWYWQERDTYMVTIRGVRHNLGPDKKKAMKLFKKLMDKCAVKCPLCGGYSEGTRRH